MPHVPRGASELLRSRPSEGKAKGSKLLGGAGPPTSPHHCASGSGLPNTGFSVGSRGLLPLTLSGKNILARSDLRKRSVGAVPQTISFSSAFSRQKQLCGPADTLSCPSGCGDGFQCFLPLSWDWLTVQQLVPAQFKGSVGCCGVQRGGGRRQDCLLGAPCGAGSPSPQVTLSSGVKRCFLMWLGVATRLRWGPEPHWDCGGCQERPCPGRRTVLEACFPPLVN